MTISTPAPRGIYTPVTVFFLEDENIDWTALQSHILRLAAGGVSGLVISGSNGEAVHLTQSERCDVIKFARQTLDDNGFGSIVIIAGCGTSSTRGTIQLCKDASQQGAAWALVLPPSYWVAAMSKPVLVEFFKTVADESPIPILIYNFPAVTGGIDLDSDILCQLASHPNIVGTKLTCCNLGKLQRITTNTMKTSFRAMTGKSDAFLQGLVAGSSGVIGALVNLVPKTHVRLLAHYDQGEMAEAQTIQRLLSDADWALVKLGVSGLKSSLAQYYSYGSGRSRKPLRDVDFQAWDEDCIAKVEAVVQFENSLA